MIDLQQKAEPALDAERPIVERLVIKPGDWIGDLIDKKCPNCNTQMLGNKAGDEWCSSIECNYGCEDVYKKLGL
jgi:hypothetical protein